jgi:GT2 family glycosyltransferase
MRPVIPANGMAQVTVVVPVFNAPDELDRCLASVFSTVSRGTDVLIIDDASTDPATSEVIDCWRSKAPAAWKFQANRVNRGFVATANAGMRACLNDVILLNSDTEVTPGWLQGLQRCLASDPGIATATPWTNNGEIASLPRFCEVNPVPPDAAAVAEVISRTGPAIYPELPTAVGFCMAISRRAIDRVGGFDEELFGKGYGEENDFSRRVAKQGMRNVLCDDVYVVHLGGRSFGPIGLKPDQLSMERLLSRHPDYLERVQAFITADPLRSRREEILSALSRAGVPMG